MIRKVTHVITFLLLVLTCASAQAYDYKDIMAKAAVERAYRAGTEHGHAWFAEPMPTKSFVAAVKFEMDRASDLTYWKEGRNHPACADLNRAGIACSYNLRYALTLFLSVYGVTLFPELEQPSWPFSQYHGTAQQNQVLEDAIRRNLDLFADGDLTADEVKRWK